MWYKFFDTYILGLGFVRRKLSHCVYFKQVGDHLIKIALYVNDMFLIEINKDVIKEVKSRLSSKFGMKDISVANFIMGMEIRIDHANRKIWLNQRKYVETILQKFNMKESKSVKIPIPVGVNLYVYQCSKT